MDKERYEKDRLKYKNFKKPGKDEEKSFNYRLIRKEELPK